MIELAIAFWLGGAFLGFFLIEAPMWQRVLSSLLWFTFPLWGSNR